MKIERLEIFFGYFLRLFMNISVTNGHKQSLWHCCVQLLSLSQWLNQHQRDAEDPHSSWSTRSKLWTLRPRRVIPKMSFFLFPTSSVTRRRHSLPNMLSPQLHFRILARHSCGIFALFYELSSHILHDIVQSIVSSWRSGWSGCSGPRANI